jgi:hypothetical protein
MWRYLEVSVLIENLGRGIGGRQFVLLYKHAFTLDDWVCDGVYGYWNMLLDDLSGVR